MAWKWEWYQNSATKRIKTDKDTDHAWLQLQ